MGRARRSADSPHPGARIHGVEGLRVRSPICRGRPNDVPGWASAEHPIRMVCPSKCARPATRDCISPWTGPTCPIDLGRSFSVIEELDSVVLTSDLPEYGLKAGDIGTVVMIHQQGAGFEVEFCTLEGET